ncbi:PREDICTED: substance-P receptor-like, partial [Merops nubicus]|uniref:substance-P receptor-like n=1 Tax=Merops nubicus TaxID=57421 RepID=UPI0004F0AE78
VVIGVIWLLAFLLACPQGYYSVTEELPGRVVCLVAWPEHSANVYGKTYHFCMTILIYFLPLLVIGWAYTVVGITLWASEIPGDSSDRYHEQVSAKRKVVKMMIIVVCTFALCWLPYHVYFTLQYINPEWYLQKFIQQVYLAIMWLAMSSTMYNPIIYCCLNDRFRVGFKHAFRWCPFISPGEYEGLEMKSARYLQTQSSMYKVSRIETTVSSAVGTAEEELEESSKAKRLSVDMTSNGSSRSDSKTVSESFSFYSNTLT